MIRLLVGPDEKLLDAIAEASGRHAGGSCKVIVAFARWAGVLRLLQAIDGRVVPEFIVGLNNYGTTREALVEIARRRYELHIFYKHPRQTFHPKVYLFEGQGSHTLLVGSSNLTSGGLATNFETSVEIVGPDAALLADALAAWSDLLGSPFSHQIESEADLARWVDVGLLVPERRVARDTLRSSLPPHSSRWPPTSPPEAQPHPTMTTALNIDERRRAITAVSSESRSALFYVGTLTPNDVEKLQGRRVGTFGPDLGESARDLHPAFWGWPENYTTVVRQVPREEWNATGVLYSTRTPAGTRIRMMLWSRPPRPGHPAEHRFQFQPISAVRDATPGDFDAESLIVIHRAGPNDDADFAIHLITRGDPRHESYATYLHTQRPRHRFGYGG